MTFPIHTPLHLSIALSSSPRSITRASPKVWSIVTDTNSRRVYARSLNIHRFFHGAPDVYGSVFYVYVAVLHTETILNNYTASVRLAVSRCSAASVEGKEELFSTWYTRSRIHTYTHTCARGYVYTSSLCWNARSRLSTKITVASSSAGQSPSVIERSPQAHTYYIRSRRVMARKKRRHCVPRSAGHTSLDSRFESNEGYILL